MKNLNLPSYSSRTSTGSSRGKPIATWNIARGVWETTRESLFCEHSEPYSEIWPRSGTMRNGQAFELPTREPRTSESVFSFLPAPVASDWKGPNLSGSGSASSRSLSTLVDPRSELLPSPNARDHKGGNPLGTRHGTTLPDIRELLPTPSAGTWNDGEGLDSWEERRERNLAKGINGNGQGTPLSISVQYLPTPVRKDADNARNRTAGRSDPDSKHHDGITLGDVARMQSWGKYATAIWQWEQILGRPAPEPTEPGRSNPRLSAKFVEFMMGLPEGWVTDVPGLSRKEQLHCLGNGVVPAQAALALYELLARMGE